jgi:hypothetical protein
MARIIHYIISCMQRGEGEVQDSRPGNRGGELSRKVVGLSVRSLRSTNLVDYSFNPFIPNALKYLFYLSKVIGPC